MFQISMLALITLAKCGLCFRSQNEYLFQNIRNCLVYTSYRQMERNAKIAFSTHQNSEKEHTRTDVPLNFGFSNRQMSHFQVCNIQKINMHGKTFN